MGMRASSSAFGSRQIAVMDMDFEGLSPALVAEELSSGYGISGTIPGVVKVFGESFLGLNSADFTNFDDDFGTPNELYGGPGIGLGGASIENFEGGKFDLGFLSFATP